MPLADERRLSANTVARELAPAGRRSRPKTAGAFLQKNRCATEREHAFSPRILGITKACLFSLRNASTKLRILAPLPTTTPESASLCALPTGSIVSLPLPISGRAWRPGTRKAQQPLNRIAMPLALAFLCYGGLRKDPFGDAGFLSFRSANLV